MASTPAFDFQMPGKPDASLMDWFVRRGFDTWCVDMEGCGRSDKQRDINCDISNGAEGLPEFFRRLPNPDKHFTVMPGIAHNSTKQHNYRIAYHIPRSFFSQPEPIYRG